jgi:aminoglycoside 2'-N-acetyltransferase I
MLLIETIRTYSISDSLRKEVLDLCNTAFGQPFDILFSLLPPDGTHLLGREDGRLVAHLVITDRAMRFGENAWMRAAYIDAVATHPDFQKRGFAGDLLSLASDLCRERYDLQALSTNAPDLYTRHAFLKWSGKMLIEGEFGEGTTETEEQGTLMVLFSHRSKITDFTLPVTSNWRPGGGY